MKSASYPVIEEAFQLSVWIAGCVERMPRSDKFTIGDRLHTKSAPCRPAAGARSP
jgi:hypothetical protein